MPRDFAFLGEWLRHCSGNSMLAAIRITNELTNSWRGLKLPSDIRSSGFLVFLIFPVFISLTLESNAVLRKGSIRAYSHGMSTGGQNLLEARIILWTFCPVAAVNDERSQRGESSQVETLRAGGAILASHETERPVSRWHRLQRTASKKEGKGNDKAGRRTPCRAKRRRRTVPGRGTDWWATARGGCNYIKQNQAGEIQRGNILCAVPQGNNSAWEKGTVRKSGLRYGSGTVRYGTGTGTGTGGWRSLSR
jgi:hypothetical protein